MTQPKIVYQAVVFSFFRGSAGGVLKIYSAQAKRIENSAIPDYRLVLSNIIGDYLFRCPNLYAANLLHSSGAPVFLYEFSLPTKTPGFDCCDGLACHTAEVYTIHLYESFLHYFMSILRFICFPLKQIPYVFDQHNIISAEYSFLNFEDCRNNSTSLPDVFAAASSWFVGVGRNRQTDYKVSKLMVIYSEMSYVDTY